MPEPTEWEVSRQACLEHAQQRAFERFKLRFTRFDLEALCLQIVNGGPKVVPLEASNSKPERFLIALKHQNRWLPVIWDRGLRAIVTVLPKGRLEPHRRELSQWGRKGRKRKTG